MSLTFKIIDAIEDLTDAPFAEKDHTHTIDDVENLQSTLNGKAASNHTHSDYLTKSQLIDLFYPIGSIYTSMNNTNPQTIFGGTWTQITDRFLYCANSSGTQGGSKKITVNQLPTHTHEVYMKKTEEEASEGYSMIISKRTSGSVNQVYISGTASDIQDDSSSSPDDYLPPYITVYAWHRTG